MNKKIVCVYYYKKKLYKITNIINYHELKKTIYQIYINLKNIIKK